ncbi:MAG: hypothetical protein K8J08_13780 [Thermoanaerobaculia bacterium]|nr:hypothetical protein [Thermoanaerobaculia bacterium]
MRGLGIGRLGRGFAPLAAVLLIGASPSPSGETSAVPWTSLTLEASKLGLTARSTVEVKGLGEDAAGDLIAAPGYDALPSRVDGLRLLESTSFLGRLSQSTIWFDGKSGETWQREVIETGKRERYKASRFTRQGVFTVRVNPTDGERGQPMKRWTNRRETFYPLTPPASGAPVIEPGVLVYQIATGRIRKPGETETLYAFSDESVLAIEAEGMGFTTLRVDYQLTQAGKTHRVASSNVQALEIALRAKPTSGASEAQLELLGLQGDVKIFLDPQLRLPLRVSGRVRYVGRVDIELQAATLD